MLCRRASVSSLGEPPHKHAILGVPQNAGPLLKVCASKQVFGNDKGAIARMVLEALSCLNLDDGVLSKIRAQLNPPPPAPKPSKRLADLEVKIEKAQHDLARLQNVVVKKQA